MTIPSWLTLRTMTIQSNIGYNVNLDVIVREVPLSNDGVLSVNYKDYGRSILPPKQKKRRRKEGTGRSFGNQCSLKYQTESKVVDAKIFNNGSVIVTGCTNYEQSTETVKGLRGLLKNLRCYLTYPAERELSLKEYKTNIRKKLSILDYLNRHLQLGLNSDLFIFRVDKKNTISKRYQQFMDTLERENSTGQFHILLRVTDLLRKYWDLEEIERHIAEDDSTSPQAKLFLQSARDLYSKVDEEDLTLKGTFPSSYNVEAIEDVEGLEIKGNTVLINGSLEAGYNINRTKLAELLKTYSDIGADRVEYYQDNYPGVVVKFAKGSGTVIFFNSGKINITSVRDIETLVSVSNYVRELVNSVRSQVEIKKTDSSEKSSDRGENIKGECMIHKRFILRNPRNVRLLNERGLLHLYR